MSYTIDVYRGAACRRVNRFDDFALFVVFFPQLVAGPIERATAPAAAGPGARASCAPSRSTAGLLLHRSSGLSRRWSSPTTWRRRRRGRSTTTAYPQRTGPAARRRCAFAFQIYGDFSGYSDIARGLAKLLGFELMVNFQHAVLRRQPQRVLAALAHLAVDLAARLPVHPARRQPRRRAAHLPQPDADHAARRPVARRRAGTSCCGALFHGLLLVLYRRPAVGAQALRTRSALRRFLRSR